MSLGNVYVFSCDVRLCDDWPDEMAVRGLDVDVVEQYTETHGEFKLRSGYVRSSNMVVKMTSSRASSAAAELIGEFVLICSSDSNSRMLLKQIEGILKSKGAILND
ncbi:MAG: hypothetical protein JWP89_2864 [Schlesneria sp.]|nr:hypothetical protein [Schlesneria sp.]